MIARVIIYRSSSDLDVLFDYKIPEGMSINPGDRVLVPFSNTESTAFCIEVTEKTDCPENKIKEIIRPIDEFSCITKEMLDLMKYMKDRFFLKYIDILRLFVPSALRVGKVKELVRWYIELNPEIDVDEILSKIPSRSQKQREILNQLKEGGMYLSELNFIYGSGPINTLIKHNYVLKTRKQIIRKPLKDVQGIKKEVNLTKHQQNALDKIFNTNKDCILLHGVTGSGKTVVYMQAINKVLSEGKTAIMLVPEISLTPQMLNYFRGMFGDKVAMLHSGLTDGERFDEWEKLLFGEAKIVVGARSAIFAPLQNVGIIVVDEEHDSSYVSDFNPRYKVHDIAAFRAKYNNSKVVFGSATPSLDSYKKANSGEYELISMPDRISDNGLPQIDIVDMKNELRRGNNSIFSSRLQNELKETLNRNEQAMLFINRLGYSTSIRCTSCGYVPKCTHCDVALSYHKKENKLVCHYCGSKYSMLSSCPECNSHSLKFGRLGTEKVVEELRVLYPNVSVLKLDSSEKTTKLNHVDILRQFSEGKAQVLVGTQMIAKGHDFSNVTLVGMINADMDLFTQDYRATERTFQLVTQMAGRAGRAEKPGKVILQTYSPNHYVYRFAINHDYLNFYKKEINVRETTSFPPYVSLIRVLVSSLKEDLAKTQAREIYIKLKEMKKIDSSIISLVGMPSPVAKIKNSYRYQMVMRLKKENEIKTLSQIYGIIEMCKKEKVTVFVEQDPQTLM